MFRSLKEKCKLTEFDGKVRSITYCTEEMCQTESGESCFGVISMGTGDG